MAPQPEIAGGRRFSMSVSGISSSSFFNAQSANLQNQQQWQQEFQKLGQELQAGSLPSPQATAQATAQTELTALQPASPDSSSPLAPSGTPAAFLNVPQGAPKHGIHAHTPHHLVDAGDSSDTPTQDSSPLGQSLQSGTSATAQQAYSAWQQDLQQVGLNSDLLTAQGADWQPASGVSLSA
jgi:hypothetical protein